jgi:DNA polymerase-3 subunit gamma/tau
MQKNVKSDAFVVTARKWRPLKFSEVVGQEHITKTLKNAIVSNRVHHAYLFSGPRGVGKTTTARIYARAVNYPESIEMNADEMPPVCKDILDGRSMDVIEIDGASNNSVDDIRGLRENAKYPPSNLKYKIYIIDEVHMLSTSAFNALLKTLEEPPPHLLFVFATTEIHKVPATILSRCQKFDFKRMNTANIIKQLSLIADSENIKLEEKALIAIAKKADGSMRDAQSIFDQVIAFCGNDVKYDEMADALHLVDEDFYFQITDAIIEKEHSVMFDLTQKLVAKGYDLKEALEGLMEHIRDLLAVKVTGNFSMVETASTHYKKFEATIEKFTKHDFVRMLTIINNALKDMKFASQPRIRFELALSQLASIESSSDITELLNELRELKKKPELNLSLKEPAAEYKAEKKIKQTETKKEIKTQTESTKSSSFSSDPNMDKWKKMLKSNTARDVSAFLNKAFPDFEDNKIIITVDSKFIYDSIEQAEARMKAAIAEFFGEVQSELKLDENAGYNNNNFYNTHSTNKFEAKESSVSNSKEIDLDKLHSFERFLIVEMKAKRLN